MRPIIVFAVLGSVIAIVAALVITRSATKPNAPQVVAPFSPTEAGADPAQASTPSEVVITNVVATTPDQDREAERTRATDDMKDALLEGLENQGKVEMVRSYLQNDDAEVRKTAVETLVHLNDKASIAALKQALEKVQDPREKVAILDAIEYLETPEDPMVALSEQERTNSPVTIPSSK